MIAGQICPVVCKTTFTLVLNWVVIVLLIAIVAMIVTYLIKKVSLKVLAVCLILIALSMILVGIEVNTCDSGCKKNYSIKFENELFGEKD